MFSSPVNEDFDIAFKKSIVFEEDNLRRKGGDSHNCMKFRSLVDSGQRGSLFHNRIRSCLKDPIEHNLIGLKIIGGPLKYRRSVKNRGPFIAVY